MLGDIDQPRELESWFTFGFVNAFFPPTLRGVRLDRPLTTNGVLKALCLHGSAVINTAFHTLRAGFHRIDDGIQHAVSQVIKASCATLEGVGFAFLLTKTVVSVAGGAISADGQTRQLTEAIIQPGIEVVDPVLAITFGIALFRFLAKLVELVGVDDTRRIAGGDNIAALIHFVVLHVAERITFGKFSAGFVVMEAIQQHGNRRRRFAKAVVEAAIDFAQDRAGQHFATRAVLLDGDHTMGVTATDTIAMGIVNKLGANVGAINLRSQLADVVVFVATFAQFNAIGFICLGDGATI